MATNSISAKSSLDISLGYFLLIIKILILIYIFLGFTFIYNKDIIEEGDTVIIYLNHMALYMVVVRRGCTLNMKYGALRHEFLIGKR